MTNSAPQIKYIYHLPFAERSELCKILNQNNTWEELAGNGMKYDVLTIQNLRKEKDPTDELLTMWGHQNHTISELFVVLAKMQHFQSMLPLKKYVQPKLHRLLYNDQSEIEKSMCELKIDVGNFNQHNPLQLNNPKVIVRESNDQVEIPLQLAPSDSNNLLVPTPFGMQVLTPVSQPRLESSKKINNLPMLNPMTTLPQVSYNELTIATNKWSNGNILGKGGFGVVYRGIWKNTDVAIKKLECRGPESAEKYMIQLEQSLKEIQILNSRPHENVLALYAYSVCGEFPCLVYQLMSRGSVEDNLHLKHCNVPLTWLQRHEIAKGVARGLQYLHTIGDKPLIHGDIKTANILLNKNYEPKIGDFGLARDGPVKDQMQVSRIHGTRPYLPDEFLIWRILSTKVDTYSYGIVLLELATGQKVIDESRSEENLHLKDYVKNHNHDICSIKDPKPDSLNSQICGNLMILGKWCSNDLARNRPEMRAVYEKINSL